ncbi:endonuclease [Mesoplasma coleopterae]|uniref:Ribonuclease n=1 Tax=Mesoplasma coleopterae TaxID=324078 RepID=A0A2K8P1A7_9MOLU|nr:endonuclease [Mesoplasma coleopterae]ATZ20542.1 ribonuclease [Mesoplasma coleopterae]AVN62063.1 hypothetical protein CG001_00100 [Mesoplasma coleopterae]AVN62725.1 hypothetical protein CG000_00135 [Mesoplasma coleopterae]
MKKLLIILSTFSLSASTFSFTVSCSNEKDFRGGTVKLNEISNLKLNIGYVKANTPSLIAITFASKNSGILPKGTTANDFYVTDITDSSALLYGKESSKIFDSKKQYAVNIVFEIKNESLDVPIDYDQLNVGIWNQNSQGFYYSNNSEAEYYDSTKNLSGEALKNELYTISHKNFVTLSYDTAKEALVQTDLIVKDGETFIYGFYDGQLYKPKWEGGQSNDTWNREHIWPQSKFDKSTSRGDLHNLRACNVKTNAVRGNRYFKDSLTSTEKNTIVSSDAYFPGKDFKGDVSRALMYMAIQYKDLNLTNNESLIKPTNAKYMGVLDILLKWHKEDPVDAFEMQRNEIIYKHYQKNRNPFIDHPEYAHLIWENKTISDLLE